MPEGESALAIETDVMTRISKMDYEKLYNEIRTYVMTLEPAGESWGGQYGQYFWGYEEAIKNICSKFKWLEHAEGERQKSGE